MIKRAPLPGGLRFDPNDTLAAGRIVGHVPTVDGGAGEAVKGVGPFVVAGMGRHDLIAGIALCQTQGRADTASPAGDTCPSAAVLPPNVDAMRRNNLHNRY